MLKKMVAWCTGVILLMFTLLTATAAGGILVLGTRNEEVKEVQRILNDLGYLKQSPTGYYGENTQAAVLAFQKDQGLRQDGKFGDETRAALYAAEETVEEASSATSTAILVIGSRASEVTSLQKMLHELGYLKPKPTGYFGTDTRDAVRAFQKDAGLTVDGKYGSKTRSALNKAYANGDAADNESESTSTGILRYGSTGDEVTQVQQILYDKGYLKQKPTGFFGTNTQAAVIAFQKDSGLVADGLVGVKTKAALNSTSVDNGTSQEDEAFPVKTGDRGEIVTRIQTQLKKLGYYTYQSLTEYFGPITQAAVIEFQRKTGLEATGVVDKTTYDAMFAAENSNELAQGDKGDDVTELQDRLRELGYFDSSSTGYFGTITKASVIAFQKVHGLEQTGVATAETTALLYSDDAKKNPSASNGDDSSNGGSGDVAEFIDTLEGLIGSKYVYSTEGPDTFDCSGLVYYALNQCGESVGRRSSASYATYSGWEEITSLSQVQPGDLLFFKSDSSDRVSHMSVYVGDNQQIHAVTSAGQVCQQEVSAYYVRNFVTARRVFS